MSATATPNKRIRQIAILLSSVDASTARQLLLHLPTETAKAVRGMAGKLGAVSAEEKRRIVNEFRKAAASGRPLVTDAVASQETPPSRPTAASTTATAEQVATSASTDQSPSRSDSVQHPKWGEISVAGLLNFLRDERPAVIAVVVSQLEPAFAVQILQDLPSATNRAVLQRMATLGDVDAAAMASIEEYLSERLEEYQQIYRSQTENRRRMDALLAAAPTALREQWQAALSEDATAEPATQEQSTTPETTNASPSGNGADSKGAPEPALAAVSSVEDSFEPSTGLRSQVDDTDDKAATILPFPSAPNHTAPSETQSAQDIWSNSYVGASFSDVVSDERLEAQQVDSSFIRLDFDSLLSLKTEQLAAILSEPDSQTVLLALAGATPTFMQRFYSMLRPQDADALRGRLSSIGAINLRDVDNAQLELLDLAERFLPKAPQRQAA